MYIRIISRVCLESTDDFLCKIVNYIFLQFFFLIIVFPFKKCTDSAVSDKTVFHSFARTLAPAAKVSKSVVALLVAFKWNKIVIVTSDRAWSLEVAEAIKVFYFKGIYKARICDMQSGHLFFFYRHMQSRQIILR